MGHSKKKVEELIEELEDWDEATREEAAKALGNTGEEKAIDALLKALMKDQSEDVRAASARSLGKFYENKKIAKELGVIFEEEISPIVRIAIAYSIGNLENISAAKLMIPILEQEESIWVREAIIEAFGKMKSKEFTRYILKHLKEDPSQEVRVQAATSLLISTDPTILDNLLLIFQSETSDEVKSRITEVISTIPDLKSVDILTAALEDDEFKLTRATASEALYRIAKKLGFKDENDMIDST